MKNEVLAPGGSLDHALWALEGGADAVYVGFQKFSARSHADNLSLDDIASLTTVAKSKGSRVFCAVNTILRTEEVLEALSLAWELYFRGVDALIVQDLGFAYILKKHGPPLSLHASTQAAVHNPGGVAALKSMGFNRVVLARELTMPEIGKIVEADPEMEYEVFIHGALCYAVSGNCMASGMMIGRSANRGDCGQICRTKFELDYLIPGPKRLESPHEEDLPEGIHAPPGEKIWKSGTIGAFASMNDLELGARIRELRDLGVVSFKIEGRMKPPAYSYNTARAYKAFLEGGNDQEAWGWLDEARVRFGRLPSAGWFDGHKALAQTNPGWAGSLGMPLGVVSGGNDHTIRVGTETRASVFRSLAKGDGVMILGAVPGQTLRTALTGPATVAGTRTELTLAEKPSFDTKNGTLWLLSRHDGKLPVKKGGKPWRHPIAVSITLKIVTPAESSRQVNLQISTPDLGGFSLVHTLPADDARGDHPIEETLGEIFRASDSRFGPGSFLVDNQAGPIFVQPRLLKELRRHWYTLVEDGSKQFIANMRSAVESTIEDGSGGSREKAPKRGSLSPLSGVNKLTGFVVEWENLRSSQLPATPWGLALPLAPFTPQEESYFERFRGFLVRLQNEGIETPIFPGLSNPCHISWVHRLRSEGFRIDGWFADWGFHAANPWTFAQLDTTLPGLAFAVPWLEDIPASSQDYFPPYFTSRACMLRNSFAEHMQTSITPQSGTQAFDSREWILSRLNGQKGVRPSGGPRCPDGCAGHFSARLLQGKTSFRVEARDCINYLIAEDTNESL